MRGGPPLGIRHPMSIASPKKVPPSPTVRTGELHGRSCFISDGAPANPVRLVDRGRSGRRELPPEGDADHCRILQEEWLLDVLLRQVAHGR